MRNAVFIQLREPEAEEADWIGTSASGMLEPSTHRDSLSDLAGKLEGKQVIVMIPGTEVFITRADIPTRNRQRLLKAIPYALEEQLLEDVERMHFAVGARDAGGHIPVVILPQERMQQWQALLSKHHIHAHAIIPATLCIPWQSGQWSAMIDETGCMVRTGKDAGFCTDHEPFAELCALALESSTSRPEQLVLYQQIASLDSAALPALLEQFKVKVIEQGAEQPALQRLAQSWLKAPCINLLQGEFSQSSSTRKLIRPWYPAAATLLLLLGTQLVMHLTELYTLNRKSSALQTEIEQLFRQTLPEVKRIVQPRTQMEQTLRALQGGQREEILGFLPLLDKSGYLLKETPNLQLTGLRFQGGKLDIELTINNLQSLEQMKTRIEKSGLQAEIRSATRSGQQVTSRMRIWETRS